MLGKDLIYSGDDLIAEDRTVCINVSGMLKTVKEFAVQIKKTVGNLGAACVDTKNILLFHKYLSKCRVWDSAKQIAAV